MKLRFATQKHTDNRIKLINEVLKGIKVVKTYACKIVILSRFACCPSH